MTRLVIHEGKCIGCGLCVRSCASNALTLRNKKAALGDGCVLCGFCVDTCRFGAIELERSEAGGPGVTDWRGIWVFVEHHEGKPLPVALELLGRGRELADRKGCSLTALLLGNGISGIEELLISFGADRVLACEHRLLERNSEESHCAVIQKLVEAEKPEILLFGATSFGRSLAPRIAARLKTGLTADCTELDINLGTGLLEQTRPAFGGNLMATIICPNHRPQMATVRPGVMHAGTPSGSRRGDVVRVNYPVLETPRTEHVRDLPKAAAGSIANARVIVSAGKGIGSQKNLALVSRLASLLGGEMGVSRPLVDAGWSEYGRQIGQTGCTVAPRLLIACGISGSIQHLAGIGGAKTIVAINSDPHAPIFRIAHYAAVGDCVEILKEMIADLEGRKGCVSRKI